MSARVEDVSVQTASCSVCGHRGCPFVSVSPAGKEEPLCEGCVEFLVEIGALSGEVLA